MRELGNRFSEISRTLSVQALKDEIVDLFVYLLQACIALDMNLEEEYLRKMRESERRFNVKKS